MIRPQLSTEAFAQSEGRNPLSTPTKTIMATNTESPEENMTSQRWFDEGGQQAELQRIGRIKSVDQQKEALQQFNEQNNAFLAERGGTSQPLPQRAEKAKTHPGIEAAIDDTMKRETGWMREMNSMSDEQLRERRLDRMMGQDQNRGRLAPGVVTLSEYKASRPDVVEYVGKLTRTELERKEILSRMVGERRFNITKAKIDYERHLDPKLVQTAERNLADRNMPMNSPKYNDTLYAEVSGVKRTLGNAKTVGFKI
jgi:hypothetical protein